MDDRSPILVVDDDPDILDTVGEVIAAEGIPVVVAANGQSALDLLAGGLRPSLVVLDLMMPVVSGWEVLAAIRADRALADVPVVVLSASGARAPAGATCFLRKPVELDTLLEVIRDPRARTRRRERLPSTPGRIAV